MIIQHRLVLIDGCQFLLTDETAADLSLLDLACGALL
jgi:hypothetical protein